MPLGKIVKGIGAGIGAGISAVTGSDTPAGPPGSIVEIRVRTGDRKGGVGTDANVWVALFDATGRRSKDIHLKCRFMNKFERGQVDKFKVSAATDDGQILHDITEIELWRDTAKVPLLSTSDWFCDLVTVIDNNTGKSIPFPVQRWVQPDYRYHFPAYDTYLPQDDPHPGQRVHDLDYKRNAYKYKQQDPLMPGLLDQLPKDEKFSDDYRREITLTGVKSTVVGVVTQGLTAVGSWNKFEDIKKAFCFDSTFPVPECVKFWQDDEWFAAMRLVGPNPSIIKLCTKIPQNFPISDDMVKKILDGDNLGSLTQNRRLFIVDLAIMKGLPTVKSCGKQYVMIAPMALFFLDKNKTLMPLAIQLNQQPGPDNPIFTPLDEKNVWTLAKMWFGLADSNYHQPHIHLGLTHLAMESANLATQRNLAPNHPIYRLLAPHFLYILAINKEAMKKLVNVGGAFDSITNVGREGTFELVKRGWQDFRLDKQGNLPVDLQERGVLDPKVLPTFPYRDDGMPLHKSIKDYVSKVLDFYYGSNPAVVKNDDELKNWGKELNGLSNIKGIPNNGVFKNLDDVKLVCASIIFTCAVQHAAVNFPQYDIYGYLPNMPLRLVGDPPKNKDVPTEAQLVQYLPDKNSMFLTMTLMKTLSMRSLNPLGDWEVRYQFHPEVLEIENEWRDELAKIRDEITKRNKDRSKYYQYTYLDPKFIPNSISI